MSDPKDAFTDNAASQWANKPAAPEGQCPNCGYCPHCRRTWPTLPPLTVPYNGYYCYLCGKWVGMYEFHYCNRPVWISSNPAYTTSGGVK